MMFAGKRVFITGAATGIGKATAEYLVAQGTRVFGAGLDGEEGKALAGRHAESQLIFRASDLTREAEVQAAVAEATEQFGGLDEIGRASCRERV